MVSRNRIAHNTPKNHGFAYSSARAGHHSRFLLLSASNQTGLVVGVQSLLSRQVVETYSRLPRFCVGISTQLLNGGDLFCGKIIYLEYLS